MSNPTPLIDVEGILVKLECVNATGSIKDRIAKYILERSQELGLLKSGQTIVEATSGNTGIAVAYIGRKLGHPVTIVMPENMTEERKDLIRSLGADLVLCSEKGSFTEAAQIRDRLAEENGWFNPDQFSNPLNVECHRLGTGAELISQADGRRIDAFAAGIGTGGTLIGVGEALRAKWHDAYVAAVEPRESAIMTGGEPGSHLIFGIGDGFIPAIASDGKGGLHPMIDEVIVVSSQEALDAAHRLRERHGLCVGISSGANYLAAKRLQERFPIVATVFADGYGKYESHGLCASKPGQCAFESACLARSESLGMR
jgi:cysteine synthase A